MARAEPQLAARPSRSGIRGGSLTHSGPPSRTTTSRATHPLGAPTSPSAHSSPPSAGQTSASPSPNPTTTHRPQEDRACFTCCRPDRDGLATTRLRVPRIPWERRPRTGPAGSVPRAPCPVSRSSLALPFQAKHQAHPTPQGPTSPHQHAQRPQPHRNSSTHSGPLTSSGASRPRTAAREAVLRTSDLARARKGHAPQHAKSCCEV